MLVLIDNYDSFTYNLLHRLGEVGALPLRIYRNDEKSVDDILAEQPAAIILSPGPCTPDKAGVCLELCRRTPVPLLGVCLGHQSLAQAFGAKIVRAETLYHGKVSGICHDRKGIFDGLTSPFQATRYHSLTIDPATLPAELMVTATTDDDAKTIMAIQHRQRPLYGVQFHPESIKSPDGFTLLENFIIQNQLHHRAA